jgi:hypothetical protein
MPTCINLKERFGRRYRVTYEESYRADRGDGARAADPWLMIVPGRYGHIFPHGGNTLAASVDGHPNVAGVLRRLPCCRVHQDGDDGELTVLFDVGDFAKVAKIIRPRCRRQLSPEQRQAMVLRLQRGPQTPIYGQPTAQGCEVAGQDGPNHLSLRRALFDVPQSPRQ